MRNFASTLVKFSKLSHIQTTIWRPPKMAPPRTAGSAGPFVTPLATHQNDCNTISYCQCPPHNFPSVRWIPAHCSYEDNELANQIAKRGSNNNNAASY